MTTLRPAKPLKVKRDDVLPGGGARGHPALHLFHAIELAAIYRHGQRLWPAHLTAFNRKPGIVVEKNTSGPTIGVAVFPKASAISTGYRHRQDALEKRNFIF